MGAYFKSPGSLILFSGGVTDGIRCLVLSYILSYPAGHGGSVKDTSGDEADNKDETMVPVDYKSSGQITDDEILKEVSWLFCRLGLVKYVGGICIVIMYVWREGGREYLFNIFY